MPRDATGLGSERTGSWHGLPSEDWIVLERDEWTRLLPTGRVTAGDMWHFEQKLVDTLLTRFYPTTELNDLSKNRIDERSLSATVLAVEQDRVRARIDGRLKMKHPFYPNRDDNNFVEAAIVGVVEFEQSTPKIHKLQIVTQKATYGGQANGTQPFGVAVHNVP